MLVLARGRLGAAGGARAPATLAELFLILETAAQLLGIVVLIMAYLRLVLSVAYERAYPPDLSSPMPLMGLLLCRSPMATDLGCPLLEPPWLP